MLKRTFTCFQNSKGSFFGGKDIKKRPNLAREQIRSFLPCLSDNESVFQPINNYPKALIFLLKRDF